jgi:hypothetical protein
MREFPVALEFNGVSGAQYFFQVGFASDDIRILAVKAVNLDPFISNQGSRKHRQYKRENPVSL